MNDRRRTLAAFLAVIAVVAGCCATMRVRSTAVEMERLSARAGDTFSSPADEAAKRPAIDEAVAYARSMVGMLFDPLVGRCGDVFGRIGFVVCTDVPLRAYSAAGISMPALLREAVREHPEWFAIDPKNQPDDRLFCRRVWNYSPLFRTHPRLTADRKPQAGDWVFCGKRHVGLVVEVGDDGGFLVAEASPMKGRVVLSDAGYMKRIWGPPVLFGRLR